MTRDKDKEISRRNFLLKSGGLCSSAWLAASGCSSVMEEEANTQALAAPTAGAGTSAAAATTNSDVGSLFPLIQSEAVQSEFPLSFLNPRFKNLNRWKQTARAKVFELLHYSPRRCHPAPEVAEKIDCGDFVREKIYFNTTPAIRVPAYLLVPKNARGRLPAIVALHDHGGYYLWGKEKLVETENDPPAMKNWRKTYYGDASIASVLARQGYVVMVIDMFYWGERRMLLDNDPADWRERPANIPAERIAAFNQRASQSEQLVGRTIFAAGFTWAGVMFWDDIRSVDYLVTRPEVDPNRIGCVGLSVGGLRSAHLAALDDRIKASVAVGWMASFPAQLQRHVRNSIGHTKVVPGLYRHLDYPDVASLAMPGALLVINGKKDGLFEPNGVATAFDKLAKCYRKAGIPERVKTSMYDAPHEFNAQMQEEAWAWLKRWV
jgi:dienelactone hydrolase